MNCLVQIKEAQKSYTSTEKMIAQYILEHTHDILNDSAQQLGEKSQTSAAAVIRFAKKLGYKGFTELKMSLAQSQERPEEDIDTVLEETDDLTSLIHKSCQLNVSTVQKTYQMINEKHLQKAIDYIVNAQTIYLFGVGSSAIVAYDFSQKLLRIGKKQFIILISMSK
ncbi:MurR/RpiR family transcriptional regulator [Allocoprobacillus halotolerans]|uniref:MurR/RpiR family transcriptional regulator n=1 Tax=Allocoprobacillus halotolerans TaxID=2944914 RepID=A0ABY5I351_9FIRM|nr:MurR/RpiR family transcriptional regulator [Allocoprobacillus halotolerans]UTY39756.1 MurR/RpiR family transcriptional regulator [Allocoprobacillus halotolerans]